MKIQMFLIPKQLKTYSQVLTIAREVEWGLEKNYDKMQKRLTKRPSQLMDGEDSVRLINVPLTKRSFQLSLPQSVCNFCHKPGQYKRDYWMINGLCLACGTRGHLIRDCPFRKIGNIVPIRPTLSAPPVRRNPRHIGRRAPYLSQRYSFNQAQRWPRAWTGRRKRQTYNLTEKGAQISDKVRAGGVAQYPEPWRCQP